MKKNQTTTAKKETKVKTAKKEDLKKVNLSQFAKQLEKVEVKEKKKKQHIYIYPEGFTEQKINSEEGKKFRNKLRNAVKRFSANILTFAKTSQLDNLQKEIKDFLLFYKINYRINDLTLSSLSNTKNKDKEKEFSLMLSIIKELQK